MSTDTIEATLKNAENRCVDVYGYRHEQIPDEIFLPDVKNQCVAV